MLTSVPNSNVPFSLQNCTDESVVLRILTNLTFTGMDSGLRKGMLIWAIETEMSKGGSMTPKILSLLELVAKLDYTTGKVASEKMREAYCAVAVDCVALHLERENYRKYAETVQKIWRERIPTMAQQGKFGLVDGKTLSWVNIIEGASSNGESREKILSRNKRYEAHTAIKCYLAEAYKEIPHSISQEIVRQDYYDATSCGPGQMPSAETWHKQLSKKQKTGAVNSKGRKGKSSRNRVRPRKAYTRWNIIEEVILINGVQEFGLSQWGTILNKYPDVFEGRTGTNLKDKWRTMTQ